MVRASAVGGWTRLSLGLARGLLSTPLLVILSCHTYSPVNPAQARGQDVELNSARGNQTVAFVRSDLDTARISTVRQIRGRVQASTSDWMRVRVDSVATENVDATPGAKGLGLRGSLALIPISQGKPLGFNMERREFSRGKTALLTTAMILGAVTALLIVVAYGLSHSLD